MKSTFKITLFSFILVAVSSLTFHEFTSSVPLGLNHLFQPLNSRAHNQLKMTTRQLTLNLSNIFFPDPAKQGDNLNLSSLRIPGTSKCANGYIFKEGKCQLADLLLMQDLDARNLIIGSLNLEQLKTKQKQFVDNNPNFTPIKCEGEKPYLSRRGCIDCSDPYPYFNLQTSKCSQCPEGSSYNPEVRNCQKSENNFLSNLQNKNYLVLPQKSLNQYKEQYAKIQQENKDIRTCPIEKPFSLGGECITCPEDNPLFFLPARTCTRCRSGSTFNPQTNSCNSVPTKVTTSVKETQQDEKEDSRVLREKWTVQKGLGNIFGWTKAATGDSIDRARDLQLSKSGSESNNRSVTTTTTRTKTSNRLVRKQTDSEDEPEVQGQKSVKQDDSKSEENERESSSRIVKSGTTKTEVDSEDQK